MSDIDEAIDQAFNEWVSTQGLENMTNRDIYDAGFRHGHEIAKENEDKNAWSTHDLLRAEIGGVTDASISEIENFKQLPYDWNISIRNK